MSTTRLDSCLAAIKAACAANHGTNMNCSEPGFVTRGRPVKPPRLPFIAVASPLVESRQGGAQIGSWLRKATVDVVGWRAASARDLETRVTEGEAFANALVTALEAAAGTAGNALYGLHAFDVQAASMDTDTEEAGSPPAQVVVVVSFEWQTTRGFSP